MNYYLKQSNSLTKLIDDYITHDRLIVGIDFDSTLKVYHKYEGEHCNDVIQLVRDLKEVCGTYNILWTANKHPDKCAEWCEVNGVPIDNINENAPEALEYFLTQGYPEPPRKLFFNILLDNIAGLSQTYNELKTLVDLVKTGVVKKKNSYAETII